MDTSSRVREQAAIEPVTVAGIVRSKEFNAGVIDVRSGRSPRYDDPIAQDWNYERGRQWALLAPMRMPTKIGNRVNWEAVMLLHRLFAEGAIV
jgi:hypothetical protein